MTDQHTETPPEAWPVIEEFDDLFYVDIGSPSLPAFETREEAEAFAEIPVRLWERDRRIADLEGLLREALEPGVFGQTEYRVDPILTCTDIEGICEVHGYGAVMCHVAAIWAQRDLRQGSSFTVGSCKANHERWLRQVREQIEGGDCD